MTLLSRKYYRLVDKNAEEFSKMVPKVQACKEVIPVANWCAIKT